MFESTVSRREVCEKIVPKGGPKQEGHERLCPKASHVVKRRILSERDVKTNAASDFR